MASEDPAFHELKKKRTMEIAMNSAIVTATGGGITALAATAYLTKFNANFNKYMSISAKTSLPVMTVLFLFSLQYELKMHDVQINPKKYGIDAKNHTMLEPVAPTTLPIHHRLMNYFHDHPFSMIAGMGIPFVGYILKEQMKLKHITFSQRLLHTRVFGQFGVITIAMTVMAFKDYMDTHGKFQEPKRATA